MNIEAIREYCISKKHTTESFPFDETTLVFKLHDKMFALLNLENKTINLKADPEYAITLREEYEFIIPGWHMNKKHWNTVDPTKCPAILLKQMIDDSYQLIFDKLPKRLKDI
jgi:predicted DNA-binding protein (MmcQ/YjbR family)